LGAAVGPVQEHQRVDATEPTKSVEDLVQLVLPALLPDQPRPVVELAIEQIEASDRALRRADLRAPEVVERVAGILRPVAGVGPRALEQEVEPLDELQDPPGGGEALRDVTGERGEPLGCA